MSATEFEIWAKRYRAEAAADKYGSLIRSWELGSVCVSGEREPIQKSHARQMVLDTTNVVALVLAFYDLDCRGNEAEAFLGLQAYDSDLSGARYLLILEMGIYRKAHLCVQELRQVDLADLWGAVRFDHLTVRHCDDRDFDDAEHEQVVAEILRDVRCDFPEDDLEMEFNASSAAVQVIFTEQF